MIIICTSTQSKRSTIYINNIIIIIEESVISTRVKMHFSIATKRYIF